MVIGWLLGLAAVVFPWTVSGELGTMAVKHTVRSNYMNVNPIVWIFNSILITCD